MSIIFTVFTKNNFFTLLFIGFLPLLVFSQRDFSAGFYGGFGTSQIRGDGFAGFNKGGLAFGLYASRAINEKTTGRLGLGLIQKGSIRPGTEQNNNTEYIKIALNYAEVPLLVEVDFNKFIGIGGLSFASLISHREEDFGGVRNNALNARNLDVSLILGGGIHIGTNVNLFVTYQNSLLPIADAIAINPGSIFGAFGGAFNQMVLVQIDYNILKR